MKKILLIEDDRFVHDLYRRALEKEEFEVISSYSGEDGLKQGLTQPINLILLDIMLPKLNGVDVLRQLKTEEQTKKLPVILLTNLGQESIVREAFKLGAQGYLLKARLLPSEVAEQVKKFFKTGKIETTKMRLGLDNAG